MYNRPRRIDIALVLSLVSGALHAGHGELAAFKEAIRKQYDIKEAAFAADDVGAIVDGFYAPDIYSVDFQGTLHEGRAALRPVYEQVVPPNRVRIESIRTKVSGDLGWDFTNFTVMPEAEEEAPFSFVILFLWERRDGRWEAVGEMYVEGVLPTQAPNETSEH